MLLNTSSVSDFSASSSSALSYLVGLAASSISSSSSSAFFLELLPFIFVDFFFKLTFFFALSSMSISDLLSSESDLSSFDSSSPAYFICSSLSLLD
jgi:hypothetical protein